MNETRISVVIPCYNAERYVAAAVRSVLAQRQAGLEIIVVDDGSSDGSVRLLRESFPEIEVLEQRNQGVSAARNAGIANARGEWIAFLDADDIWLPGKLDAQLRLLRSQPGARMAYTAWQEWPSSEPEPQPSFLEQLRGAGQGAPGRAGASGWIYPELLLECAVWTSTVLAHRSLFNELGPFDTSMRVGEDWDLWLRVSRVSEILRVCEPLALYRKHAASLTQRAPEHNYKAVVLARAIGAWGYRSPDGRMANVAQVQRGLVQSWSNYAVACLIGGEAERAWRGAVKSVQMNPLHAPGWKVLLKAAVRMSTAYRPARG